LPFTPGVIFTLLVIRRASLRLASLYVLSDHLLGASGSFGLCFVKFVSD